MKFFSIRHKFFLVTAALVFTSIGSYLYLATTLFKKDKTSYIYDSSAALVKGVSDETQWYLKGLLRSMGGISQAFLSGGAEGITKAAAEDIFNAEQDFVGYSLYKLGGATAGTPLIRFSNRTHLENEGLDESYFERLRQTFPENVELAVEKGIHIQNVSLPGAMALFRIATLLQDLGANGGKLVAFAYGRVDNLQRIVTKSKNYKSFLIDSYGSLLVHPDSQKILERESFGKNPVIGGILQESAATGSKEYEDTDGTGRILAYSKVSTGALTAISIIDRDKAFSANRRLVSKSIRFAAFILAIAFWISAIFTQTMTRSLKKLYEATRMVATGQFNLRLEIASKDEVGALATSFNAMTGEIMRLLAEVRDKARMEKELETARIVQETLFPSPNLTVGNLEISSFYLPASECGGDWCGHFQVGNKVIVLIGDATGHGVPAALITAAAQSCCTTVLEMFRDSDKITPSPAAIINYLNKAIYQAAKGRVKMTFVASVIDSEAGVLTYANASHEIPLVFRKNAAGKWKTDVLAEAPGAPLGESYDTVYNEYSYDIKSGDFVVWYTDGLLECRSKAEEEWGERNLVKSVNAHINDKTADVRDLIVKDAMKFIENGGSRSDDITFVVGRIADVGAALPKVA